MTTQERLNLAAWAGVGALILLACALIWSWTPGMTILGDEWRYAEWTSSQGALERGFDPDVGKYSIPVPLVVYQGLFEGFGLESHLPFRLMAFALLAIVACVFFELVRRRIGPVVALLAVALVLFLGTSSEVLATSLRSPAMMSLAASLLALLALERATLRRDLIATALLAVAVACHPGGLAFCAAALVIAVLRPAASLGERLLRAWVGAAPILFFVLALRPAPDDREEGLSLLDRAAEAPEYLVEGVVGLVSRAAGFAEGELISLGALQGEGSAVAWLLAVALVLGVAVSLARRPRTRPRVLAFSACTLILVGAALLAPGGIRGEPNLARYVLPSTVALLLLVAELLRDLDWAEVARRRGGRLALCVGGALAIFAILSNAALLEVRAKGFDEAALALRAEALAYELARDLDPVSDAEWEEANKEVQAAVGKHRFPLSPAQYYGVVDDYGSPALDLDELASEAFEHGRTVMVVLELVAQDPIPPSLAAALEEPS